MLEYTKQLNNINYLGIISYCNEKFISPKPIFIWKKV